LEVLQYNPETSELGARKVFVILLLSNFNAGYLHIQILCKRRRISKDS